MKLERMHTPKCGNIIKKFNSQNGEYYLHSNVGNDVKDPYIRYLKLYKKEKTDGHDTFRLIAQKLEVKKSIAPKSEEMCLINMEN